LTPAAFVNLLDKASTVRFSMSGERPDKTRKLGSVTPYGVDQDRGRGSPASELLRLTKGREALR
jgi:hypothetical protein